MTFYEGMVVFKTHNGLQLQNKLQNFFTLYPIMRRIVQFPFFYLLLLLLFFFRRSGKTVSRHFHRVLRSIIELEDQFLLQPDGSQVPTEILHSSRFYPYFKVNISCLYFTFDSYLVNTQIIF